MAHLRMASAQSRRPRSQYRGWPWWSVALVGLAVVLATSLTPTAEAPRPARIDGRVTGEGRAPLHGARIALQPVDTRQALTETTDATGAFTFRQVPPGRYRIDVTYETLHASSNAPLLFETGETYTLDLPLASAHDPE